MELQGFPSLVMEIEVQDLIDLSIPTLMAACKGRVSALPSLMVHDNELWVTQGVQLDSKNRIHMRRSTFLRAVVPQVPVRAGIWHGLGVQEFHIDLQPHHLQGSDDMAKPKGHKHSRVITLTDAAGRNPGDEDYGDPASKSNGVAQSDLHAARAEAGGSLRGVGSSTLSPDRDDGS